MKKSSSKASRGKGASKSSKKAAKTRKTVKKRKAPVKKKTKTKRTKVAKAKDKKKTVKAKRIGIKKISIKKNTKKPKNPAKKPKKKSIDEELEIARENYIRDLLSDSIVRQLLIDIGGENALSIIRNFNGKASDDELAKTLELKISDVRATLNRLHNEGFVNYTRQKDSETGWYSYSWILNHERLGKWAKEQTKKIITLNENGNQYYFCKECGTATIVDFDSAADTDFRCERCNKPLVFLDENAVEEFDITFKKIKSLSEPNFSLAGKK